MTVHLLKPREPGTTCAAAPAPTAQMPDSLYKLLRLEQLLAGEAHRHPTAAEQRAKREQRQREALGLKPPYLPGAA